MKEDYLWDKTGEDFEIEKLENALAVFRCRETGAPALPAKIIPFERETPRGFFRLAFALSGGAALIAICLGVWFQFAGGKIESAKNSAETIAPTVEKRILIEQPNNSIVEKNATPPQSVTPEVVKIRKNIAPINRPNNLTARKIKSKKPAVRLTEEETYAYDQLMLALSITSSKLRLVKDKVEGIEEKNAVVENGL